MAYFGSPSFSLFLSLHHGLQLSCPTGFTFDYLGAAPSTPGFTDLAILELTKGEVLFAGLTETCHYWSSFCFLP